MQHKILTTLFLASLIGFAGGCDDTIEGRDRLYDFEVLDLSRDFVTPPDVDFDAVECRSDDDCATGFCDPRTRTCVEATCSDNRLNGLETDADCGGPDCEECRVGERCVSDTDCLSDMCNSGTLRCDASGSCSDGVENGSESDVDCGGRECAACDNGRRCNGNSDCVSNFCDPSTGICEPGGDACADGIQSGAETDVDCGGPQCWGCELGQGCFQDRDCQSAYCNRQTLLCDVRVSCEDGQPNGLETDIDCGGPQCQPCEQGQLCQLGSDCVTGFCNPEQICDVPAQTCFDGQTNLLETDVDCGGPECPGCANGLRCEQGSDCLSDYCSDAGTCEPAPASCSDRFQNGQETDVDCGGGVCSGCADGLRCDLDRDCASDFCDPDRGVCVTLETCTDNTRNGSETDVDCGGNACPPCSLFQNCLVNRDCENFLVCTGGVCQPPADLCIDGQQNGLETDVDCGGPECQVCELGEQCLVGTDCRTGYCEGGICSPVPGCQDGLRNGLETDTDCGGLECKPCIIGQQCNVGSDCETGTCLGGFCAPNQPCSDGVLNGSETDVDCGGPECAPCFPGQTCKVGSDCITNLCQGGICEIEPTCFDGQRNSSETDVDCGGPDCIPCQDGQRCRVGSDCQSDFCDAGICRTPDSCFDGAVNGSETDLDCGGSDCPGCLEGQRCNLGSDCQSNLCAGGICTSPDTCFDGVTNGSETDEDCGGPECSGCADGQRCRIDTDCQSGFCDPFLQICDTPTGPTCFDGLVNGSETDVDCGGPDCGPCDVGESCKIDRDCISLTCDLNRGMCTDPPAPCSNNTQDGDETDVDCGGFSCPGCVIGQQCKVGSDCLSDTCIGGICAPPIDACSDGRQNGSETDVDCGGPDCDKCQLGQFCRGDSDCVTDLCDFSAGVGICGLPSTCFDGQLNGSETDVDCGGPGCLPCFDGQSCLIDNDCISGFCDPASQTCGNPVGCFDGIQNGLETDVDCGGPDCTVCLEGQNCRRDTDCITNFCDPASRTCAVPNTCSDGQLNGFETDIDCGGNDCAPCSDGQSCLVDTDCQSGFCDPNTFTCSSAITCNDGRKNGLETDVDCGGPDCAPCQVGETCLVDTDCESNFCEAGVCSAHVNCLEILKLGKSSGDGDYFIDPDGRSGRTPAFEVFCDMTTDGGGWTEILPPHARNFLRGQLVAVVAAPQEGFDSQDRPFTQDTSGNHTYHYTFDVPGGYNEFYMWNYTSKASAASPNTSEIRDPMVVWTDAMLDPYHGDIGFGSPNAPGPLTSYGQHINIECDACIISWPEPGPGTRYKLGPESQFRIGWGEQGPQTEGWFPWWTGGICFR